MTLVIENPMQWRTQRGHQVQKGQSLGFVPTMGALHEGHLTLVRKSLKENDHTLVSLFLNPTQFDNASDLKNYPSSFEQDLQLLSDLNVPFVFAPRYEDLYPDHFTYQVCETEWSQKLCGAHRPGHFTGVLSVVLKLLNLAQADRAYFGEKDYQQLQLIKGMAAAFFLPVQIIGVPTVREQDGLAMSSRNRRLRPDLRTRAADFYRALSSHEPCESVRQQLQERGFQVDYIEDLNGRRFGAVYLEDVRLIDNVPL